MADEPQLSVAKCREQGVITLSAAQFTSLVEEISAMRELLKELEWEDDGESTPHCACCQRYVGTNNDHAPDCKLAAILKQVEGE